LEPSNGNPVNGPETAEFDARVQGQSAQARRRVEPSCDFIVCESGAADFRDLLAALQRPGAPACYCSRQVAPTMCQACEKQDNGAPIGTERDWGILAVANPSCNGNEELARDPLSPQPRRDR
jgi:hypothetical protein